MSRTAVTARFGCGDHDCQYHVQGSHGAKRYRTDACAVLDCDPETLRPLAAAASSTTTFDECFCSIAGSIDPLAAGDITRPE
jgi:hypothetical protein